ncbi:MAG: hypothetical protein IIX35_06355 [Paraprevotella sp.]|nr:hypothetical protein [Paraprevotella sp.]
MKYNIIYFLLGLFLIGTTTSCDKEEPPVAQQPTPTPDDSSNDTGVEDDETPNDSPEGDNEDISDNNLSVGGDLKYEVCSEFKYQGNMTLLTQIYKDGKPLTHYQIAIFDREGECRACGWSYPDLNGISFLTIQGDDDTGNLSVKVIYQRGEEVREVTAKEQLYYANDATLGSNEQPYIITIAGDKE